MEVLALGLDYCPERNHDLFDTVKDVNLFVRKLTLKALHHKSTQSPAGVGTLMQLSLTECRDLRNLLLMDTQEVPSTPTPLLEALEAALENPMVDNLDSQSEETLPSSPCTNLLELGVLKRKSKIFPPHYKQKCTSVPPHGD